ncbi:MAG TPA: hypothetical protein VE442_22260 [Jatrophihabitans sp.]|nr:hypothetical protein [Jatrophihabitans sp.]
MKLDPRRVPLPAAESMALQISAGRTGFALAMMAAPTASLRALGADSATAQRVTWVTRMLAVRDGALGVGGFVAARRGGSAAPWLVAGAVSDAVDAMVIGRALDQGRVKGIVPAAVVPLAALTAAVGALTALRTRRP